MSQVVQRDDQEKMGPMTTVYSVLDDYGLRKMLAQSYQSFYFSKRSQIPKQVVFICPLINMKGLYKSQCTSYIERASLCFKILKGHHYVLNPWGSIVGIYLAPPPSSFLWHHHHHTLHDPDWVNHLIISSWPQGLIQDRPYSTGQKNRKKLTPWGLS